MDIAAHKTTLQEYFDGQGFERWSSIYGDGEVSGVRRTIREGHIRMLALAEAWMAAHLAVAKDTGAVPTALDAGCGTGLLSVALAQGGSHVTAVDIAPQMADATSARAQDHGVADRVHAGASDLHATSGRFDAVACLDVLVHYPQPAFADLLGHLADRAERTLVFTYAPHKPLLAALHWVGGRFPKGQRRTEIQMIRASEVAATLIAHGMTIQRSARISHGFYHVTLVEACRG